MTRLTSSVRPRRDTTIAPQDQRDGHFRKAAGREWIISDAGRCGSRTGNAANRRNLRLSLCRRCYRESRGGGCKTLLSNASYLRRYDDLQCSARREFCRLNRYRPERAARLPLQLRHDGPVFRHRSSDGMIADRTASVGRRGGHHDHSLRIGNPAARRHMTGNVHLCRALRGRWNCTQQSCNTCRLRGNRANSGRTDYMQFRHTVGGIGEFLTKGESCSLP